MASPAAVCGVQKEKEAAAAQAAQEALRERRQRKAKLEAGFSEVWKLLVFGNAASTATWACCTPKLQRKKHAVCCTPAEHADTHSRA